MPLMELIKKFVEKVGSAPWYKLLGMKIELGERIAIILEVEEKHLQALGVAHGGVAASVLDSAIGLNVSCSTAKAGSFRR